MDELAYLPASTLAERIRSRELSPVELVEATIDRIERRNAEVNAVVTVCGDRAMDAARKAEASLAAGEPVGPLCGLPIAVKDLDPVAGVRNSRGSRMFANDVPAESAIFVDRLEKAGAIVVAKTNTPEMGHRATTDNYLWGPTSSPFDPAMNSGGSSGGSASAVGAGLVPLATGSDAGGSLRVPAAFCGVFTMMPSFGRVPVKVRPDAYGPFSPMVSYGPLARTVTDVVTMLDVMSGPHPRDPYTLPKAPPLAPALDLSVTGLRVAYTPDLGGYPVEPEVAALVAECVAALAAEGAQVEEVAVKMPRPHQELTAMWRQYVSVRQSEFVQIAKGWGLDVLGEQRPNLPPEYIELLEGGIGVSAVDYRLYDVLRTELFDALTDIFDDYDLIVSPTTSVVGVPNTPGRNTVGPTEVEGQEVDSLVGWCLTGPYNFVGCPAASIPAGQTATGMPVGFHIAGRRFEEASVVAAARAIERQRPWQESYLALERAHSES